MSNNAQPKPETYEEWLRKYRHERESWIHRLIATINGWVGRFRHRKIAAYCRDIPARVI